MTLQIISTSMQDLIVTTTCKLSLCQWNDHCHVDQQHSISCFSRYPDKDVQYHFFRNYLQPDKPSEVCEKTQLKSFRASSFAFACFG